MYALAQKSCSILAVALLLAGCGVRGPLQNPKPEGSVAPPPQNTATADSGQNKPENAGDKGHKGFILDGLLR